MCLVDPAGVETKARISVGKTQRGETEISSGEAAFIRLQGALDGVRVKKRACLLCFQTALHTILCLIWVWGLWKTCLKMFVQFSKNLNCFQ